MKRISCFLGSPHIDGFTDSGFAHFFVNFSWFWNVVNCCENHITLLFCYRRNISISIKASDFLRLLAINEPKKQTAKNILQKCLYLQKAPTIPSACAPYRIYHGISSLGPSVCPGLAIRPTNFSEND